MLTLSAAVVVVKQIQECQLLQTEKQSTRLRKVSPMSTEPVGADEN